MEKTEYSKHKIYDNEASKIIKEIRVADCMTVGNADEYVEILEDELSKKIKDLSVSNILNCSYCNVSFSDGMEQRNHFKLDWHRYNLKRALCDKKPLPEDAFENLAGDVSSISGSESESSDSESENSEKKDLGNGSKFDRIRHSKAFFENGENKIFSIYKCLLHSKKESVTNSSLVNSMMNVLNGSKKWLVIMLGGGHFAAAIFDNGSIGEHKTFHCYTVRAKQGGSQSSRDNKGGSHPKSAGASLRRYNELALVQHVQEIISAWSESVKSCQLILYRATGPYNRGVLFGGKNPPFEKDDPRLRNIPFPTRRATYKEVQRVYDMLATVEVYGSSTAFKNKYPCSPDKKTTSSKGKERVDQTSDSPERVKKKSSPKRIDRSKPRSSPEREIPGKALNYSSNSSGDEENELISGYATISLGELQEYEDTVPDHMKESHENDEEGKKGSSRRKKKKSEKTPLERQLDAVRKKLVNSVEREDKELLENALKVYDTLPEKAEEEKPCMTKHDFLECLNSNTNCENRNTILHQSALKCLPEFVTLLLEAGADPTVKNKNRLTPYVISGDKATRNSFKEFVTLHPDRIDCRKANIPEPLTDEMKKLIDQKKRDRNKMKRAKDKMKKRENRELKEEEKERERFLALSDREKCALAAERRMIASATANLKTAKPPVLSRCFQCGTDITGKVPFEYGTNRFCSVNCVKSHRLKTKSYGMEI